MVRPLFLLLSLLAFGRGEERLLSTLHHAEKEYQTALEAPTFFAQQEALSATLARLLTIEVSSLKPELASTIEESIGDIYSLRKQYAYASAYYRKALRLSPFDKAIQKKLNETLSLLDLPKENLSFEIPSEWLYRSILLFSLLFFAFASLTVWKTIPNAHTILTFLALFALFPMSHLFVQRFLLPLEGVVLQNIPLEKRKNLTPGEKVSIVAIDSHTDSWTLVTQEGEITVVDRMRVLLL